MGRPQVAAIGPCQTGFDLHGANIDSGAENSPDGAVVGVDVLDDDSCGLPLAKRYQRPFGSTAIRLAQFRRVDFGEADLDAPAMAADGAQRIAVGYADNPAGERMGGHSAKRQEQKEQEQELARGVFHEVSSEK
jgi:hypothetical protein